MRTHYFQFTVISAALLLASVIARPAYSESLLDARQSFATKLVKKVSAKEPTEKPPSGVFNLIQYKSEVGNLDAYLTPDPKDGKKHPAIIWITGGDCNTIGDVWSDAPEANDQTAAAYRKAGIVMMFPSLRGGNMNPGFQEGFYGEINDIIAASEYLAKQPYVDPARIYLGGHSTGGTMVLLVAECTDRFRSIISFGPVTSPLNYGPDTVSMPFAMTVNEINFRSPALWLDCIKSPTYVFEGSRSPGNADELKTMEQSNKSAIVKFSLLPGNHFSILAPANKLLAQKILADTGKIADLSLSDTEIKSLAPSKPVAPAANPSAPPANRPVPGAATRSTAPTTNRTGDLIRTSEVLGSKSQKMRKSLITRSDRLTGFSYVLSDSGQLTEIDSLSSKQSPGDVKPGIKTERAKDGYAVYGVLVQAENATVAMQVVYARLKEDGKFDPTDTYISNWLGNHTDAPPRKVGCDETMRILGANLYYQDGNVCGISFSALVENKPAGSPAK